METRGVEPLTPALQRHTSALANDDCSAFDATVQPVCTSVCTSDAETMNGSPSQPKADDAALGVLAAALAGLDAPARAKFATKLLEFFNEQANSKA